MDYDRWIDSDEPDPKREPILEIDWRRILRNISRLGVASWLMMRMNLLLQLFDLKCSNDHLGFNVILDQHQSVTDSA